MEELYILFFFMVFGGLDHNFGELAKPVLEFILHGYVFMQLNPRWQIAGEAQLCSW